MPAKSKAKQNGERRPLDLKGASGPMFASMTAAELYGMVHTQQSGKPDHARRD
jgi:hypothetical protein